LFYPNQEIPSQQLCLRSAHRAAFMRSNMKRFLGVGILPHLRNKIIKRLMRYKIAIKKWIAYLSHFDH